jgi:spore coat protein A
MRQFTQKLHRDLDPTTVWGYSGTYPGPTIEARTDERAVVKWINDLRDKHGTPRRKHYFPVDTNLHGPDKHGASPRTVVHLHGGHVPAESDGYPEDTFLPGQSATYYYPNRQNATTLWYHDHALGVTRLNVYMGLAGFYMIRDAFEDDLNLPSGEYEIPLLIQDRSFNDDCSLSYPATWEVDFFGDAILVNGKVWPYLEVKRRKYRFRILNGSNARTYQLALDAGKPFYQIGTDGGLLEAPVEIPAITLAPSERADVIIDFSNYRVGDEVTIPDVMKFIVRGRAEDNSNLPSRLRPVQKLQEESAVQFRQFVFSIVEDTATLSKWLINGLGWGDIREYPELGTTEVWSFINPSGEMHPIHLHLVQFQILDRQPFDVVQFEKTRKIVAAGNSIPPPPEEAGWKDTVRANASEITRIIARFDGFTGKYPYHCHILEHEDHEMMRQFKVVAQPRR